MPEEQVKFPTCVYCMKIVQPYELVISVFARDYNGFIDHTKDGVLHVQCIQFKHYT